MQWIMLCINHVMKTVLMPRGYKQQKWINMILSNLHMRPPLLVSDHPPTRPLRIQNWHQIFPSQRPTEFYNFSITTTSRKRPRPLFGSDDSVVFHCFCSSVRDHLTHSMVSLFAICTTIEDTVADPDLQIRGGVCVCVCVWGGGGGVWRGGHP